MIIPAKDSHELVTGNRYLHVQSANRPFAISSVNQGMEKTTVKAGFSYDLHGVDIIIIHNNGDDELIIDVESSDLKIVSGSSAGVEIVNTLNVKQIIDPVDTHTKSVNPVDVRTFDDVVIAPQTTKKLVDAAVTRYELMVQNISASKTVARVGGVDVSASNGLVLIGSINTPTTMGLSAGGDLYAYNASSEPLTLSVMVVEQ